MTNRGSGAAAAAADLADDRGGTDDRDGRASRGDRRVLLVQAAPGNGMVTCALAQQHLKRRGVVIAGRQPASRSAWQSTTHGYTT